MLGHWCDAPVAMHGWRNVIAYRLYRQLPTDAYAPLARHPAAPSVDRIRHRSTNFLRRFRRRIAFQVLYTRLGTLGLLDPNPHRELGKATRKIFVSRSLHFERRIYRWGDARNSCQFRRVHPNLWCLLESHTRTKEKSLAGI